VADDSFLIPEPPTEFGSGFLAEFWNRKKTLPKLSGVELWLYYLKQGFVNLVSLPSTNVVSVATITVSFFVLASFIGLLRNAEHVVGRLGSQLSVTAYIKEGAPPAAVDRFVAELSEAPWVKYVNYISKEQALESFKDELGDRSSFLSGLGEENPLPASIDLELYSDELEVGAVNRAVERLRTNALVDEVIFGSEWVENLEGTVATFRYLGMVSLGIVLLLVLFFIANTIKLVMYARRDEIEIMKLVGATGELIAVPFVLGGMLQGVIGALLGVAASGFAFLILKVQLEELSVLGVTLAQLLFVGPVWMVSLLFLGIVMGGVGSFLALGRFLRM